jgi:hypothetical protein
MHNLALALHNKGYHVTGVMMLFLSLQSLFRKKGILPSTWDGI